MSRFVLLSALAALALAAPAPQGPTTDGPPPSTVSVAAQGTPASDTNTQDPFGAIVPGPPGSPDGTYSRNETGINARPPSPTRLPRPVDVSAINTPAKPFSMNSVSFWSFEINGLEITLAEGYFWLGRDDAKAAPLIIEEKRARIYSDAPGSQKVYIEKGGALAFTAPHTGGAIPEGGKDSFFGVPVSTHQQQFLFKENRPTPGPGEPIVDTPFAHMPWLACPVGKTAPSQNGSVAAHRSSFGGTATAEPGSAASVISLPDTGPSETGIPEIHKRQAASGNEGNGEDGTVPSNDGMTPTDQGATALDLEGPEGPNVNNTNGGSGAGEVPESGATFGPYKIYASQTWLEPLPGNDACVPIKIYAPFVKDVPANATTYFY